MLRPVGDRGSTRTVRKSGTLVESVYAYYRIVLPVGTAVSGHVLRLEDPSKGGRCHHPSAAGALGVPDTSRDDEPRPKRNDSTGRVIGLCRKSDSKPN
jgi:hypothetical protein